MKALAFYAAGLLILIVMVFGGIDGFTFKFRIETGDYISETADLNTIPKQLPKQIKDLPENSVSRVKHPSNLLVIV